MNKMLVYNLYGLIKDEMIIVEGKKENSD